MKKLTEQNAHELYAELMQAIKSAGAQGLPLADMQAIDAYLSGLMTQEGRVELVTREGRGFVVWLKLPAHNPPVFRED